LKAHYVIEVLEGDTTAVKYKDYLFIFRFLWLVATRISFAHAFTNSHLQLFTFEWHYKLQSPACTHLPLKGII
jgi:hypothetical protein